jgi:hypothetical protein
MNSFFLEAQNLLGCTDVSEARAASIIRAMRRTNDGGSTYLWNVGRHSIKNMAYIPEDSELHTRRRENLKSHIVLSCLRIFAFSPSTSSLPVKEGFPYTDGSPSRCLIVSLLGGPVGFLSDRYVMRRYSTVIVDRVLWLKEPGSSVSIVSWLWTGRPGDRGSIPGRGKGFFL